MDSVFDDRDCAIEEAQKIDQSSRYSGVRVVEENYNEATDETTSRTLYRGGAAKSDNAGTKEVPSRRSTTGTSAGGDAEFGGRGRRKKNKTNLVVPVLILLVVILGGLAALFGLQQLSSLK